MKKWVLLVLTLLLVIPGCASNETSEENPVVTVKMADGGTFQVELYPDTAPNTVNNFISLVESGFYDGLTFHRVEQGLLIQGGDPNGNGTGGPGYTIQGEFPNNSFENDLKHTEGVISMARAMDPDSAGSQFFICLTALPSLDGDYATFGKVISGMDVVQSIAIGDVMESVTVDTKGVDYPDPTTNS